MGSPPSCGPSAAATFAGSQPAVIHYPDVAVAALAADNQVDARAFVAHELRGIDDDSTSSVRLRETILAYFAAGHNAASASSSKRRCACAAT